MALVLVTAPAAEPVTRAEAKLWAKQDDTADDAIFDALIIDARRQCENRLRRALVTQTWDLFLDAFPDEDVIEIKWPPLSSVTTVKYIDTAGVQQTVDAADYRVDMKSEPGRITPAYGKVWPSTRDITNAVEVRFVGGYGAASSVPDGIKTWIKIAVATAYLHRESEITGTIVASLKYVDGLLDPYVWGGMA